MHRSVLETPRLGIGAIPHRDERSFHELGGDDASSASRARAGTRNWRSPAGWAYDNYLQDYQRVASMDMCREHGTDPTRQLEEALRATRHALIQTIHAISAVAGQRDRYTARHQRLTATLSLAIGRQLGLDASQLEGLYLGALVHDIGKIAIPSELLAKPARLTAEEYALVKTHVQAGCAILDHVSLPWPVHSIIRQHHERLDGSGYPDGLSGESIILEARIVAVADVFEAITDHRPYRPARGTSFALEEISQGTDRVFDRAVVDALGKIVRAAGHDAGALWQSIESEVDLTSTAILPAVTPPQNGHR